MRIGFYIEDTGYINKDLSKPNNGNPGVDETWILKRD